MSFHLRSKNENEHSRGAHGPANHHVVPVFLNERVRLLYLIGYNSHLFSRQYPAGTPSIPCLSIVRSRKRDAVTAAFNPDFASKSVVSSLLHIHPARDAAPVDFMNSDGWDNES
jgi:hypothetical protein